MVSSRLIFLIYLVVHFLNAACIVKNETYTLLNKDNVERTNVDVPLYILAKTMIPDRMKNCSFIRFTTLIEGSYRYHRYFVENDCNTLEGTRIWINLWKLESEGVNVTMTTYSEDCNDDDLPDEGSKYDWNGEFYAMADYSTSCSSVGGGWESVSSSTKRFIKVTENGGGSKDGNPNVEFHQHNISMLMTEKETKRIDNTNCGAINVKNTLYAGHNHQHSFETTAAIPSALPPFKTVKLCKNRFLELQKDLVFGVNDSSTIDDVVSFDDMNGYFAAFHPSSQESGGSDFHHHIGTNVTHHTIVTTMYTNQLSINQASLNVNNFVVPTHSHKCEFFFSGKKHKNWPTGFYMKFGKLEKKDYYALKSLRYFASAFPPLGFERTGNYGYPKVSLIKEGTFEGNNSNHNFTGIIRPTAGVLADSEQNSCDSNNDFWGSPAYHSHNLEYTQHFKGGGDWEYLETNLDRIEVLQLKKKTVYTTQVKKITGGGGDELINGVCSRLITLGIIALCSLLLI